MKKITLGSIHIASWKPNERLYPKYYDDPKNGLSEYAEKYKKLNPDEVVLKCGKYTLIIDYPLSTPCKIDIDTLFPLTRRQLVQLICKAYKQIYREEDETSEIEGGLNKDVGGGGPCFNRNRTSGKWGIWGHVIEDLQLHSAEVKNKKITVGVDS